MPIVNDGILEDVETFLVVLSTLDSAAAILQPELMVLIEDDDRM